MNREIQFLIGTVPVRARLTGQGLELVQEFFSEFPPTAQEPRLTIEIEEDLTTAEEKPFVSRRGAKQDTQYLRFSDYATSAGYVVKGTREAMEVHLTVNDRTRLAWRQRLQQRQAFSRFYFDPAELALSTLIHGLWHWLMLVLMVQRGSSFAHASCVEKDGKALMLPALGGVGKTSLMYQLVSFGGWKFLADDFTILTAEGTITCNPEPIAVYPYNLLGLPEIEKKVLTKETRLGRRQWQIGRRVMGLDGVGRRIAPRALFGAGRLGTTGQLGRVIYLQRWGGREFELRETSPDEIAGRMVSVMLSEIRQFRMEYNVWNSMPNFALFPALDDIAAQMKQVFCEALARCRVSVLYIPQGAIPPELYRFLSSTLAAEDSGNA